MKRYLVFYGSCYYPAGGMKDLIGQSDELHKAIAILVEKHQSQYRGELDWDWHWGSVFDLQTGKEVFSK